MIAFTLRSWKRHSIERRLFCPLTVISFWQTIIEIIETIYSFINQLHININIQILQ